ncbi:hypothetical protein [Pseudomonas sp.]|uniref:hypothetical protein n=1 Tax=Pseudomonas sp. TaxID=306 RepID=UPI002C0310CC|nr:hypothetical protein [Pseudomonas sp.]HUE91490.1 hypothetical protein [Pseudomonas sp.]
MTITTSLPKPIKQALNQLAHSRAQLHQAYQRELLSMEIDRLIAAGLSPEQALEQLRTNPPILVPNF